MHVRYLSNFSLKLKSTFKDITLFIVIYVLKMQLLLLLPNKTKSYFSTENFFYTTFLPTLAKKCNGTILMMILLYKLSTQIHYRYTSVHCCGQGVECIIITCIVWRLMTVPRVSDGFCLIAPVLLLYLITKKTLEIIKCDHKTASMEIIRKDREIKNYCQQKNTK